MVQYRYKAEMPHVSNMKKIFFIYLSAFYTQYKNDNPKSVGVLFSQLVEPDNHLRLSYVVEQSIIYNKLAQSTLERGIGEDDELCDIIRSQIDNLLNEAIKKDFPEVGGV